MTIEQVLVELERLRNKDKVILKEKKFGIIAKNALGIYQSDLLGLAKNIGKDSILGGQLYDSGIYEARILCCKLFVINDLSKDLMEKWVVAFENWEICDTFCMGLFAKSKFAVEKAIEWTERKNEFERRAGFTIIAAYCMADKKADNDVFKQFLPLIRRHSQDDRNYVKKAVNWALRNIGKRNKDLNKSAIALANELLDADNKTANWIAKDALGELENPKLKTLDYPRAIYRP